MNALIKDEAYQTNPEADAIDMVARLSDRFHNTGLVMPATQRTIYEGIAKKIVVNDKASAKKTVADVGCGLGIGSYILSNEARFVWGVDKSAENVSFAQQMYAGSLKMRFDALDINDFPREVAKFSVVACVEVLEHIADPEKAIAFLKRLMGPLGSSVGWVTLPNRNSPLLQKDKPRNPFHVAEPTASELYDFLTKHFKYVVLYAPDLETLVDLDTDVTPVVCKIEEPLP